MTSLVNLGQKSTVTSRFPLKMKHVIIQIQVVKNSVSNLQMMNDIRGLQIILCLQAESVETLILFSIVKINV
jgi:hypothetical protein